MRTSILLFCAMMLSQIGLAQNEITLHITQLMGIEAFDEYEEVEVPGGYEIKYTRMEYYLSEFVLTHDGGQQTELEDVYLLVDANDDNEFSLGTWDIESIESIQFSVGVDEAHNHLDPAEYPSGHPLAPQFPSMHWGWASGYRFVAAEGKTGSNFTTTWQIHALGDNNFYSQSHEVTGVADEGVIDLWLNADYNQMFVQLDVSFGLIEHSETAEAVDLLENMRDLVFSPGSPVGVEPIEDSGILVYPNPANEFVSITGAPANAVIQLMDMKGAIVEQGQNNRLNVSALDSGIYFVRVVQDDSIQTMKLVIQH
ncbi:MbnP family protein [Sanyastnella coralliicola]|uniref:MbnP family protein n=1 Tax=Sanyastnella coralliicola TaxID=3069118 RepID=UPI0027BB1A9F|nr:MbnP family protein [Longitalea sp. SCSIO 12813]